MHWHAPASGGVSLTFNNALQQHHSLDDSRQCNGIRLFIVRMPSTPSAVERRLSIQGSPRAPSLGHQRQRLEQRKRPAVLLFPAREHVGLTRQCAHIRIFVTVVHECGGKLEAPRRVTVQQLLQPAVTNEQFPAADNAQQGRRVATAAGVTISTRRKHTSAAHLLSSG
jgi:hypothetical protein